MQHLSRRAKARVGALTAALAAIAAALTVAVVRLPPPAGKLDVPTWVLLVLFALAEVAVVHVVFNRDAHTFSLSEIPLVVALAFASPVNLVVARLVGSVLALALHRRQRGAKLLFNAALLWLESAAAALIASVLLRGVEPVHPRAWIALLGVTAFTAVLSGVAVALVMGAAAGRLRLDLFKPIGGVWLFVTTANTLVGLVVVTVVWVNPTALWLLIALAVLLLAAYRSHTALRRRHDGLERLHDLTRVAEGAVDAHAVLHLLLDRARSLVQADVAQAVVWADTSHDRDALSMRLRADGTLTVEPLPAAGALVEGPVAAGRCVVIPRTTREPQERRELTARSARDLVAVPLRTAEGVIGRLEVESRLDDVTTFTAEDVKLLEALGGHLAIALENARLVDQLRAEAAEKAHRASQDALTGLPNRVSFQDRVHQTMETADGRWPAAVLILGLDRFKEVNDTLGHQTGDGILAQIGDRLRGSLRPGDEVARLGGDEFAVLLPAVIDADSAVRTARELLAALERPFHVDDMDVDVSASVGIVLWPDHGRDAGLLLQRADLALDAAKTSQTAIEVYTSERDRTDPQRLGLVRDLRTAIEQGELAVHYQPKVDLETGRVQGVEALVRWHHHTRGFVPPDQFIPVAEHTGLIRPLTTFVLETAAQQCRVWRDAGLDLSVAVNLSARSLADLGLKAEVARVLAHAGLPARVLTLEITESTLMADIGRARTVLDDLSAMGIKLSVDDFGTGYSSLAYLKELPVDELKVDRSFVATLLSDPQDAAIVELMAGLGRSLGLTVVAEGVEDEPTLQRLRNLGCTTAQGYHLSRPLTAAALTTWIEEYHRAAPHVPAAGAEARPLRVVQR